MNKYIVDAMNQDPADKNKKDDKKDEIKKKDNEIKKGWWKK